MRLEIGAERADARFESGHSKEEKMAAVHYLRFALGDALAAALADPAEPARLVVEHPHAGGVTEIGPDTRQQLIADLTA